MKVEQIAIPKQEAKQEWKLYNETLKERKELYLKQLRRLYFYLKGGKKVIDVFQAMKKVGLTKNNEPRLAIVRADAKEVFFHKQSDGSGYFTHLDGWHRSYKYDIILPDNTFPEFPKKDEGRWADIIDKDLKTIVPIIPAKFLPRGKLHNYYLLWEVEKWEIAPPKDPILLKRITKNLFVALACWNLTPLERALIRGR